MFEGKKRVWSEEECERLFEKHKEEIGAFRQSIGDWLLAGGDLLDFAPRLALFHRRIIAGGGTTERIFALLILFMLGFTLGRAVAAVSLGGSSEADDDDNGGDSGSFGENGTGAKN